MLRQNYMCLIVFAIITKLTESICPGQFWNPLNNACVDSILSLMQNVHGYTPTFIMLILPLINVYSPVQPLLASMPTIGFRNASHVNLNLIQNVHGMPQTQIIKHIMTMITESVLLVNISLFRLSFFSSEV